MHLLSSNSLDLLTLERKLKLVSSDRTVTLTGHTNGCVAWLERMLQRALQWVICLLHCNELPLRHIFTNLDGTTKSPYTLSGPIGKELYSRQAVSEWSEKNFHPILNQNFPMLSNLVIADRSSDQYYA